MLAEIASDAAEMYLDLLKKSLTRYSFPETHKKVESRRAVRRKPLTWALYPVINPLLAKENVSLFMESPFDPAARNEGKDWPADAETMVGLKRLENLQYCITQVLKKNIPGDLIETGVWRGGASIFMRAVLKAYGERNRIVWVADSFEGLPKPDGRFQQDQGDKHWKSNSVLGVSLEQVKTNFARYSLLDDQVRFLPGWFKDTLPAAPIQQLAILRLDGDMYSSTTNAIEALYPKLSPGGYLIVDDYGSTPPCRQAVDDFRAKHQITEPLQKIDWTGVFWEKAR
jgi:O-methyltransferase